MILVLAILGLKEIECKCNLYCVANPNGGGKRKGRKCDLSPRPSLLRLRFQKAVAPLRINGKGAGCVMAVTVLVGDCFSFSPMGETGEGFLLEPHPDRED